MKCIRLACDEIKNSDHLKQIIAYVLTIGNILNGGTTKGQADGFSLDILTKIGSLKDNSGKTLTQFICAQLKKEDENFEGLKKEFLNVTEAGKVSVSETQGNLNKLKKEIKDQKTNLQKLGNLEDEFTKKSTVFLDNCTKETEEAEKELASNIAYFQETVTFLGYLPNDPKYKNPEEFFNLINEFLNDVDRSMPKVEPKKVFNRKHEVGKKLIEKALNVETSLTNNMDALIKEMRARPNA